MPERCSTLNGLWLKGAEPPSDEGVVSTLPRSGATGYAAHRPSTGFAALKHRWVHSLAHRMRHHDRVAQSLADRLAAARSSTDVGLLVDLGCELSDAGEHLDAAWCFRTALDLGTEWVAFNLGNELVALGRDHDAVDAYGRASAAGEHAAWLNLGDTLERLGDLGGALRAYGRGQSSGDVNAGMARALLLRQTGEHDAAVSIVDKLAATGSPFADAVAACWMYDRTLDSGLEHRLRAGADLHPGARADLADILRRSARLDEAVHVLQRGIALDEVESYLPLAKLYDEHLHDAVAAEAIYRAGILCGDNHCHHNLAVLLQDQDRLDEAREHYTLGAAAGDTLAQRPLDELGED